jgi:deferrochelatase/peroxidase EfeB
MVNLPAAAGPAVEPFYGARQGGIVTPQQSHTYFAAFDLTTRKREDVVALLRTWTHAAERMSRGEPAQPLVGDAVVAPDGGSALGLGAARLTLTFGFGVGLFLKDGVDRYGLAAQRPEALAELPKFNGDQLEPARCGGDLSVQACANDPQVAFHAVRELERLAYGSTQLRWAQSGFLPSTPVGETARNLMGFKDGTNNPSNGAPRVDAPRSLDDVVWVDEGPVWMRGGSYLVARRIRISLEHWDRTDLAFQEEVIGRHKYSGAPIGKQGEFDPLDLDREDSEGTPIIAETAHVRLGAAAVNGGAQILRRAYSYNDGVKLTAERWPPWRQGMMYDAGLFFLAYQRDPRTGFSRIFENMAKFDMLNQYTTHNASALFACPRGVAEGEYIGQHLFQA